MADIFVTDEGSSTKVALATKDGHLNLDIHLDLITALDNRTSITLSPPNFTTENQGGKTSSLTTAIPFCALNRGHWDTMDYDPSLVALFSGPLDSPSGTAPSKGKLSSDAIVGISVGVAALVIMAAVGIGLLTLKSTTFKRIVRPFTSRKNANANLIPEKNQPSTNAPTTWAPASKPTD